MLLCSDLQWLSVVLNDYKLFKLLPVVLNSYQWLSVDLSGYQ